MPARPPRLLVLQHFAAEHPGVFRRFLARDGIAWRAVELDAGEPIPPLEEHDALLVMGGAMDVWDTDEHPWLVEEKRAIRRWVTELGRPYLGICLGHQLLADALGGTCGPMREPEVGVMGVALTGEGARDALLAGTPATPRVLQWHSVRVAQPPEGAVVLASSDTCRVQAMRVGRHAWGLQYHIEVEADAVAEWAEVPGYCAALERVDGPGALGRLEAAIRANAAASTALAEQVYRGFMGSIRAAMSTPAMTGPAVSEPAAPVGVVARMAGQEG